MSNTQTLLLFEQTKNFQMCDFSVFTCSINLVVATEICLKRSDGNGRALQLHESQLAHYTVLER